MLRRPLHLAIVQALRTMDHGLLLHSRCFFGGGTAIVLLNEEYRLSLDVDFLCADQAGYRRMRETVQKSGLRALFGTSVEVVREAVCDQYGIRGAISFQGHAFKFEIIREARIDLNGACHPDLGVPVLGEDDQVAEKLLANSDRCFDRSVACRDAIDLGILVRSSGVFPKTAVEKAEAAYGNDIRIKAKAAAMMLSDPDRADHSAAVLQMSLDDVGLAARSLSHAIEDRWPDQEAVMK